MCSVLHSGAGGVGGIGQKCTHTLYAVWLGLARASFHHRGHPLYTAYIYGSGQP